MTRDKKFVPKGLARDLGLQQERLEKVRRDMDRKSSNGSTSANDPSRRGRTKTKKRTLRGRRDESYAGSSMDASDSDLSYASEAARDQRRTVRRRRSVRSAVGPWAIGHDMSRSGRKSPRKSSGTGGGRKKARTPAQKAATARMRAARFGNDIDSRDPAWVGESGRHAKAARAGWKGVAKKGWQPQWLVAQHGGASTKSKKKKSRDPAWVGESSRHAKAARSGWRGVAKRGWEPQWLVAQRGGTKKKKKSRDPAWVGDSRRHATAAREGWRNVAHFQADTGREWAPRKAAKKSSAKKKASKKKTGRDHTLRSARGSRGGSSRGGFTRPTRSRHDY